MSQPLLFRDLNPLVTRFGAEFFRAAPREPGVYLMRDKRGEILYVGKAKCLRNRLNSYKNARANIVSRKVLRMLRLTHTIETRICESEQAALLTENGLLRAHRPPFNIVNTHPETYYFITLRQEHDAERSRVVSLVFGLTNEPGGGTGRSRRFGVFKGRGRTRDSFGALLRLVSALSARDARYYFPAQLVRHRPPSRYALDLPRPLFEPLCDFLHGRSRVFLDRLVEGLLSNVLLPRFIHHVVEQDLKMLEEFYTHGPQRVRALKKTHGIRRRAIRQEEIDDLLVLSSPV